MSGKPVEWIPTNVTPETLKRVEAYSRYRRIGRAEAAGALLEAGIAVVAAEVKQELDARHERIRARLLPGDSK